jgi:hypothetical protein
MDEAKQLLKDSVENVEEGLKKLNNWVFETRQGYYPRHQDRVFVVNEKTRNLYTKLRPVLNEILISLQYISEMIEND